MSLDSPLVRRAAELAREAHAGQVRKSAGHPPYFVHLESVAQRLAALGHDDELVLAVAYLHDLLEDQPVWAAELRLRFPPEVVETVEVLTERKCDAEGNKRPKMERFIEYLAGLRADTPAALRATAVSCADKLDNALSLIDCQRVGDDLLSRLNTRPGQHAAQLAAVRGVYVARVSPALLAAFDAAVSELSACLAQWLPGHAVAVAAAAHRGQFDKAGKPYVYHPLRMLLAAATDDERMTAVLHDVVEDTPWTLADLADEGFPGTVLAAVDCLTRREHESYDAFIERIAQNPLATRVKLLDLADNVGRLEQLAPELRPHFAEKYRIAEERLRRVGA